MSGSLPRIDTTFSGQPKKAKAPPFPDGALAFATNGALRLDGKSLVVILAAEVRDQIRAHNMTQRVLQLHRLNKQNRARDKAPSAAPCGDSEIEAQPLLNADRLQRRRALGKVKGTAPVSSAMGAARITESRQRKFTLSCIG